MELKGFQRKYLTKAAHSLSPVVMLGKNGLTDSLKAAVDEALDNHELIKLKFIDFKGDRHELSAKIAELTKSSLIRVIGNIAILYRMKEDRKERKYHVPGSYNKELND